MEEILQLPENNLTVLDCFCGAGIGAIGVEAAGFNTIYAFDNNKHAVRNFNKNIKNVAEVVDANLIDINKLPNTDIITGGFPCKPWSSIGKRKGEKCDKNGNLAGKLIEIILTKEPKAFLIENVKGLIDKKNKPFFDLMIGELSEKYKVYWKCLDCSLYGVPQRRERVFIVGVRKDIEHIEYQFPKESNITFSINDALNGLSEIPNNENNHDHNLMFTLRKDEIPFAHKISEGGHWRDLSEEDAKLFLGKAHPSYGKVVGTGYLAVMDRNKTARTILSTPMGKNCVQIIRTSGGDRRFTVRESLRLQTVPDWFSFDDETPIRVQYERCSGIPSLISYKIMKNIYEAIGNI